MSIQMDDDQTLAWLLALQSMIDQQADVAARSLQAMVAMAEGSAEWYEMPSIVTDVALEVWLGPQSEDSLICRLAESQFGEMLATTEEQFSALVARARSGSAYASGPVSIDLQVFGQLAVLAVLAKRSDRSAQEILASAMTEILREEAETSE